MGIIGQSIPVRDAAMKVTGQFKYTADLEFPECSTGKYCSALCPMPG